MRRLKDIDPSICKLCATMRRADDREECRRRQFRKANNLAGVGVTRFPQKGKAEIVKCRSFKPRARVGLLSF